MSICKTFEFFLDLLKPKDTKSQIAAYSSRRKKAKIARQLELVATATAVKGSSGCVNSNVLESFNTKPAKREKIKP